jgi:hypothetical protein
VSAIGLAMLVGRQPQRQSGNRQQRASRNRFNSSSVTSSAIPRLPQRRRQNARNNAGDQSRLTSRDPIGCDTIAAHSLFGSH